MTAPLLSVRDLTVSFDTPDGVVHAVNGVSFDLEAGSTLAIVGESGSGKSVMVSSILRLNSSTNAHTSGRILLDDRDILAMDDDGVRAVRGADVAMVFQDPLSALNPYYTVGDQIAEAYLVHHPAATRDQARERALDMLRRVGIPNPEGRIDEYPHQFSGGMRQRIVIAIALVNEPRVLIADEPTTALDVTVQAQILDLMVSLQGETGMAIVLITHDLGVVAEVARDVIVMYGGRVVEHASVPDLFSVPTHPYAHGLLAAVRSLDSSGRGSLASIPGTPPSMLAMPTGCAFHPRCPHAASLGDRCRTDIPVLRPVDGSGSVTACHMPDEVLVAIGTGRSAQ